MVSESLKAKVGKDAYAFVDTPVVYCTDLDNMIETVIEEIGGFDCFELKLGVMEVVVF